MAATVETRETFDGLLEVVVTEYTGQAIRPRNLYLFQRNTQDYRRGVYVVDVFQINLETHLIEKSGFSVVGKPNEGGISVWADETNMPEDMARAFIKHLYPEAIIRHDSTDYADNGMVVSHDFEVDSI